MLAYRTRCCHSHRRRAVDPEVMSFPAAAGGETTAVSQPHQLQRGPPGALPCGIPPFLPHDLLLHVLSLLPPNDLALGGRLSCKEAAQRFSEPHHRTARLSQPLPGHVAPTATDTTAANWCISHAQAALRELTLRRKLLLLCAAAASGCEANVEFALELLQPHVFSELLQTEYYLEFLQRWTEMQRAPDAGSAVVAGGLAHLLPSLAQRCPGLLDPGRTLEAAARHCDPAGLQAAWEAVGQRLLSILDRADAAGDPGQDQQQQAQEAHKAHGVWRRVMSAAAGSPCPDAEAKMAWVLDTDTIPRAHSRLALEHAEVWGAAAGSGDLARLRWLRSRGFLWSGVEPLAAVLRHADLGLIVRMEQEGGYLPPAGEEFWGSGAAVCAAAGSARESADKLGWLAARGAALGRAGAVRAAAARGDLEVVQLLVVHLRGQGPGPGEAWQQQAVTLSAVESLNVILCAVVSRNIPTAMWLEQQGCGLYDGCFLAAFEKGDLAMLRWLMQAGCPRGTLGVTYAVIFWPNNTDADLEGLVEAVQLLAAEGWPLESVGLGPIAVAALRHPWAVWRALLDLGGQQAIEQQLPGNLRYLALYAGCEATVEAVVEQHVSDEVNGATLECAWYFKAVQNGDRGTLSCLRRLGVPLHGRLLVWGVRHGAPLVVLKWLVEQGAPCCSEVVQDALAELGTGYPAPREQERREVEVWLRGRLGERQGDRGRGGFGGGERGGAGRGRGLVRRPAMGRAWVVGRSGLRVAAACAGAAQWMTGLDRGAPGAGGWVGCGGAASLVPVLCDGGRKRWALGCWPWRLALPN